MKQIAASLLLLILASLSTGCGDTVNKGADSINPECDDQSAAIAVHDGFLMHLCGCAEAIGTTAHPGETLTCTINAGDVVVFVFIGKSLPHQIVPTAGDTFLTSPVFTKNTDVRTHAVPIPAAGTYPYTDQFLPSVQGEIVAL